MVRRWRIGVASNSSLGWVKPGLERFGLLGHVGAIRSRDTAARPKPHPDPYLEVLAELGCRPSVSYAFEASATGIAPSAERVAPPSTRSRARLCP